MEKCTEDLAHSLYSFGNNFMWIIRDSPLAQEAVAASGFDDVEEVVDMCLQAALIIAREAGVDLFEEK